MPSVLAGLVTATDLFSGSGKTQVVDGSGNVIGSQLNGTLRGLAVTQAGTFYELVASNTSTAQLAASATFTGSIEYSADQQAISILCTSDQPVTLTLAEFIDAAGTRQSSSRTFNVTAGVGFSRAIQLNGNYFRVSAQNTGASTTTTFALDVALGTLQSQTQAGNQPVSISEIDANVTFPLPAGAAASANQTNGNQRTQIIGGGNLASVSAGGALSVNMAGAALDATLTGGTARSQLVSSGGNAASVNAQGEVSTRTGDAVSSAISIAANATVGGSITGLSGVSTATVQLTGTWVATVQVQVTVDGTNWSNITGSQSIVNLATGAFVSGGNLTANGVFQVDIAGCQGVRVITTAYTSGTVAGSVRASTGSAVATMPGVAVSTGGALSTQVVDQTAAISIAANATSSGQITGASNVGCVVFQLNGTWVGTVQLQITRDNTTWINVTSGQALQNVATSAYGASLTANGVFVCPVSGISGARVISTAWTSGTVTGTLALCSSVPPVIQGNANVSIANGTVTTVSNITTGTIATVTAANLNFPQSIADVASAAITTTATTAAFTPTFGCSYIVGIVVTATSGTPTGDFVVQESDDTGTNWRDVYHFPRITAVGQYRSPKLSFAGNRVRYVQTIGGGTPSITRSINRLQCSDSQPPYRQLIDRTVTLTTLSSTTPSLDVSGIQRGVVLTINVGAITTTAPALQLQGSDDNGATWYALGSPLTAVASSTVSATVAGVSPQLLRAIVTTAGVGVTAGYVLIRGF